MNRRFAIFAGVVIGALLLVAALTLFQSQSPASSAKPIAYSQFLDALDQGQVRSVTIDGTHVIGTLADRTLFQTYTANDPDLVRELRAKGVLISVLAPAEPSPA